MDIKDYLKKNLQRSDIAELSRRLPHIQYQKIWRHLNGFNGPDQEIIDEAIKLFKERKEKNKKIIQELQSLEV